MSSAFTGALGKDISKKNSLPSAVSGALGKVFSKKKSLPSARSGTLGKEFLKKKKLSALGKEGRDRTPLRGVAYAECRAFAESLALGKEVL